MTRIGPRTATLAITEALGAQELEARPSAPAEARFSSQDLERFLALRPRVAIAPMTTAELKRALAEVQKRLVDAKNFDLLFQRELESNDLLRQVFLGYRELLKAGAGGVPGESPEKSSSAEVTFNYLQAKKMFAFWQEQLDKLAQARQETPVDVAATGAVLIRLASDVRSYTADPLAAGEAILEQLQGAASLNADATRAFAAQMARCALKALTTAGTGTGDQATIQRGVVLLHQALAALATNGETKKTLADYFDVLAKYAQRLDGDTGAGYRLRALGAMMASPDAKTRAAFEKEIVKLVEEALELRKTRQLEGKALSDAELETYRGLADIAWRTPDLLGRAFDAIEHITGRPDANVEGKPAYAPSQPEVAARIALTLTLLRHLDKTFPSLDRPDLAAKHLECARKGSALVATYAAQLPAGHIVELVTQLSRHAEEAMAAADLPKLLLDPNARLDSMAALITASLRHGNLDAAFDLFTSADFQSNDPAHNTRCARVLADVTAVLVDKGVTLKGSRAALEWVGTAYRDALERSLMNPPDWNAAYKSLEYLAKIPADRGLSAEDARAVVERVLSIASGAAGDVARQPYFFFSRLTDLLARYPNDPGCMATAKDLFDRSFAITPSHNAQTTVTLRLGAARDQDVAIPCDNNASLLAMLRTASSHEIYAGYVQPLFDRLIQRVNTKKLPEPLVFARTIAGLGAHAPKDALARGLVATLDAQSLLEPRVGELAAALAPADALLDVTRGLVARAGAIYEGRDAATASSVAADLLFAEIAVRTAMPNLASREASVGLLKALELQANPAAVEAYRGLLKEPGEHLKEAIAAMSETDAEKQRAEHAAAAATQA